MDLTFTTGRDRFNVRVAVVVVARDRVLLQGVHGYPWWIPPGGRCSIHESSRHAAERELAEELGCDLRVGPLLWMIENFFELDGFAVHELTFVYAATLPEGDPLLEHIGDFAGADGDQQVYFRWVSLTDLASLEVYPHVLRTRCASLPTMTEHLVIDQRR